jgi:hypothetical protein
MLRNKTLKNIINDCDFYKDTIEYPGYIKKWHINPPRTFDNKTCWILEYKRLMNNPKFPGRSADKIFGYKTNKSLGMRRRFNMEPFISNNYVSNTTTIINKLIIIFFVLMVVICYNN